MYLYCASIVARHVVVCFVIFFSFAYYSFANAYAICSSSTFEPPHDKTNKVVVRLAKTQISGSPSLIRVFTVAQWVAKDLSFLQADSEDSDRTWRMPRLI